MTEERQREVIAEALGCTSVRMAMGMLCGLYGGELIAIQDYPTDLTACSALIDFLEKRGYACVMVAQHGKRCCTFTTNGRADCKAIADTFPRAICKSFLTVLGLWE